MVPFNPLPTRPDLRLVEQTLYKCGNEQNGWQRLASIDFTVVGVEGIRLTDATNLHFSYLDGRDDPMFEDEIIGNSVSCRIEVRGRLRFTLASLVAQSLRFISLWDTARARVPSHGRCDCHGVLCILFLEY